MQEKTKQKTTKRPLSNKAKSLILQSTKMIQEITENSQKTTVDLSTATSVAVDKFKEAKQNLGILTNHIEEKSADLKSLLKKLKEVD